MCSLKCFSYHQSIQPNHTVCEYKQSCFCSWFIPYAILLYSLQVSKFCFSNYVVDLAWTLHELDSKLVAYIISGLVVVRYSKFPIKLLNIDAFTFFYLSFFCNFSLVTGGVATALHVVILNFFRRFFVYFFYEINIPSFS